MRRFLKRVMVRLDLILRIRSGRITTCSRNRRDALDASVPASVRGTPIQRSEPSGRGTTSTPTFVQVATDRQVAVKMDRVKADHDALEESAQRVKASAPADVRNTPVQPSTSSSGANTTSSDVRRNEDNEAEADRDRR